MKLTVPLSAGTLLTNVRYEWISAGSAGPTLSTGIVQPDIAFPFFDFTVTPPAGAEEMIVFDATDFSNWNLAGYQVVAGRQARMGIPLRGGTVLSNVIYRWIVNGVEQPVLSTGISQPDPKFSFFQFLVTPPTGADEIIAYDSTDATNWNPGGFQALNPSTQTQVVGVILETPTTTFRNVYESIVRRLGYNPKVSGEPKEDVGQNVLQHINDRLSMAWAAWDWPQLKVIEWRAFRTVWTSTLLFSAGDELFYFGDGVDGTSPRNVDPPEEGTNSGYYTCIATAPAGTLPTNTTYFSPLEMDDYYISYNQTNENAIGDMFDVYEHNPRERLHRATRVLRSYPSSKGIDVRHQADIVYIRYGVPCPQFTLRPFITGGIKQGDSFYDPASGNCLIYGGGVGGAANSILPFPLFLSTYVKAAAYADCLSETSSSVTSLQSQMKAMDEAEQYLMREIDRLIAQGQKLYYPAFPKHRFHYHEHVAVGAIPTEMFTGFD